MYRIRRKTRLTVLLLTALVSHFTVERSLLQISRTSAWFALAYSPYSDDHWYDKQLTWSTTGSEKTYQNGTEKRASVYTLKRRQKCGYGTVFYRFRSERVHSRLWTFLGTERIRLERVKYRLHVKFCRSRSSFYPSRSNFFGRVNGP